MIKAKFASHHAHDNHTVPPPLPLSWGVCKPMASLLRWSSGPVRLLLVSMLCLRECWSSSMSGHQRRCFWDNTRRTTRCVHKDGSSWLSTPAAQQVKQNNTGKEPSRARRSEKHARQISAKCASLDDCTGVNMYKYGIMADLEPWLQTGITQQAADLGSSWQVLKTNWSAERTSMCECTYSYSHDCTLAANHNASLCLQVLRLL